MAASKNSVVPVRSSSRRRGAVLVSIAAVGTALAWSGLAAGGPAFCPTRMLFRIPCPACGLTRAASAVAHLDFDYASRLNPSALPLAAAVWCIALVGLVELLTGRDLLARLWSKPRVRSIVFVLVLALMGSTWMVNLYRHAHGAGPLHTAPWHAAHRS